MKKLILVLLVFFNFNISLAQESIFFVDVDVLLNKSNYGKKIISKLKNLNEQNITEIENNENELKQFEDNINNVKNIITKDELNIKISELKNKIIYFQKVKDNKFKEYNKIKNRELGVFFKKITPFIEEFMEINSIKIILEKKNIFIANANYDITNKLIDFLNNKIKDD